MRRPKKQHFPVAKKTTTVSLNPTFFSIKGKKQEPENLRREISTRSQTVYPEGYIPYGEDDALPLRIAKAVEESPAASSCIDTISKFIKGSGFSDPKLMKHVIDKDGTTLWDFHCNLSDSLALFWGFSVNFKFNAKGKINSAYQLSFEACRFKAPGETSRYITHIIHNPHFGTSEKILDEHSTVFQVFNGKDIQAELAELKTKQQKDSFQGQVYYFGKTTPLSRFYPKPRYWSAKEAIQADHKLQEFTNEELDNGFFQSTLINAIGDPNLMSPNPKTQKEVVGDDGVTRLEPTETIGQEFNRQMSDTFSGSRKAGTAMVLWSSTPDESIKLQAFPTTINSDRLTATQDSITKTITIATEVPSILANISEGVSLGSGGSEIQKAVELMESRTVEWREVLENFYNNILLPNLENKVGEARVEIQSFKPVSEPVEINKDVWAFLNEAEKVAFIKKNMPEIEIVRVEAPIAAPGVPVPAPVDPANPDQPLPAAPTPAAPNEALKNLNIADLNKIQKIVARYNLSQTEPGNPKALTYDQAKQMLSSFGFTEEELNAWLVKPEEL